MSELSRSKVHSGLKKLGFGGLDDIHLLDQIAVLYKDHDAFRGLLMSVEPDKRALAYDSLRSKLGFTPKPLDVYEAEMKDLMERRQIPTWNRDTFMPEEFHPPDEFSLSELAQEAIAQSGHEKAKGCLSMVCTKCTVQAIFRAERRKEAVKQAHDAGWRWDERNGTKRTYCPDHIPARGSMTLECSSCGRQHRLRVWDEQDGYRAARLLGWDFDDMKCSCPGCNATLDVIH